MPGVYQVRGFDLSNISFVEGDSGVVVIDPLISSETASAALALYRAHRGDRPVVAVVYTHSHVDHFGGVKGVTTQEDVEAGRCSVIAPDGFMEHAIAENVYAGTAMTRRAAYMYGAALPRGPEGQVVSGLSQVNSTGTVSVIAPTDTIRETGERRTVDGVVMEFQLTPGTEAPAEMNLLLPDRNALCMAENARHTLHNILTLRGAVVRDARMWARYITEAIDLFGDRMDVVCQPPLRKTIIDAARDAAPARRAHAEPAGLMAEELIDRGEPSGWATPGIEAEAAVAGSLVQPISAGLRR